ncbi:unnamed protein product [Rotaria sordida]|uniref:Exosome RNA helicase MTR4-like stalk domain-containing protein n=1 Tax=Rotaria sordida TaxID=392033 RepID=A0A815GJ19_9BILA|nr:unnamed protein product [Rotaria sordida]
MSRVARKKPCVDKANCSKRLKYAKMYREKSLGYSDQVLWSDKKLQTCEQQYDSIKIENEDEVASYYKLKKKLELVQDQIAIMINEPKYLLPFLQPGRLVTVTCQAGLEILRKDGHAADAAVTVAAAPNVIEQCSFTVPGAVSAFIDTLELFGSGKVSLNEVLIPSIQLVEEGYPVSEITTYN